MKIRLKTFLKRKRIELGLSQGELGDQLGVHGQYVSNVERGIHRGPVTYCFRFGRFLSPKDQFKMECLLEEEVKIVRYLKLKRLEGLKPRKKTTRLRTTGPETKSLV